MQHVGAGRQGSSRAAEIGVAGGAVQGPLPAQPSPAHHGSGAAQELCLSSGNHVPYLNTLLTSSSSSPSQL